MSSKDAQEMNLALQKSTVDTINTYCRVLELQMKAISEGASPERMRGPMGKAVGLASEGLVKELELLRSLRGGLTDEGEGTGSRGG